MTVTALPYLEVNSVPLDTLGWRVVTSGYDDLHNTPGLRGEDVILPNAQGVRPYPRVIDTTVVSIPVLIIGDCDQDGTPYDDPEVGLLTNTDYLRDNLGLPPDADPDRGTVTVTFYRPDPLPDLTGDAIFLGLLGWGRVGTGEALAHVDLLLTAGVLTEAGS